MGSNVMAQIGDGVDLLASDDASGITGAALSVDGCAAATI
jgi:enoyl-[acyl-carrier-protein] reductase (NADH)